MSVVTGRRGRPFNPPIWQLPRVKPLSNDAVRIIQALKDTYAPTNEERTQPPGTDSETFWGSQEVSP